MTTDLRFLSQHKIIRLLWHQPRKGIRHHCPCRRPNRFGKYTRNRVQNQRRAYHRNIANQETTRNWQNALNERRCTPCYENYNYYLLYFVQISYTLTCFFVQGNKIYLTINSATIATTVSSLISGLFLFSYICINCLLSLTECYTFHQRGRENKEMERRNGEKNDSLVAVTVCAMVCEVNNYLNQFNQSINVK